MPTLSSLGSIHHSVFLLAPSAYLALAASFLPFVPHILDSLQSSWTNMHLMVESEHLMTPKPLLSYLIAGGCTPSSVSVRLTLVPGSHHLLWPLLLLSLQDTED